MSTSVHELEGFLQPLGLKKRANWLVKLMKDICEKHNYKIPDTEDKLTHLPGVGRYTARAVLSFGFKKDVAIVDVNVVRVLSRVFGLSERKRQPHADMEIWTLASLLVPKGEGPEYNEALLDFAALICRKTPLCHICLINEICEYYIALQKRLNV
jgi:A/G-specific adenine glycosylase